MASWIGNKYLEYVDSVPKGEKIATFEEWINNIVEEEECSKCSEN